MTLTISFNYTVISTMTPSVNPVTTVHSSAVFFSPCFSLYFHFLCRYNGEVGDVVVGRITEVRKKSSKFDFEIVLI